jgi:hypothetical protein
MCDYSLENVASRPAKVGDRLISKSFPYSITRGFAAVGDPMVAVCLAPGTELAFDNGVVFERSFPLLPRKKLPHCVARVRHLDEGPDTHRDAVEFPGGKVVLLTRLCEGQHVTVLQLPVATDAQHVREAPKDLAATA